MPTAISETACSLLYAQTTVISMISILQHCRYITWMCRVFRVRRNLIPFTQGITPIHHSRGKCTYHFHRLCLTVMLTAVLYSLRILYMPPIYAIISFCSYRFYRDYTYYSFIQIGMSLYYKRNPALIFIVAYEVRQRNNGILGNHILTT